MRQAAHRVGPGRRRFLRDGAVVAAGALLAMATYGGAEAAGARFEAADLSAGRLLLSVPVREGDRILMVHVHSIAKRPVEEEFSVRNGVLSMEEMRFDTFGANLPVGPEHIGGTTTEFLRGEDGYRVLHHGRPLGAVQVMVGGPAVDHTLTLPGGGRVRLLDLTRRGARVELRVRGGGRPRPRRDA
ncbi:DUF1850 domain-containing protein [Nocardiopsis sp. RSe5-2]|uniref:DUF1850 domain-containing protein n=1 Tax=Nocardiopsis endophytica TaxID=3018445 RepID=A0ABT4U596_9ACTN|nr:DUF1850 domain-containing protein [Nocardiopsis endophytica]MDA2812124.1 DUF1850 domain-containing protein [Nocardiopsis endophytica]